MIVVRASRLLIVIAAFLIAMTSCDQDQSQTGNNEDQPRQPADGRSETKTLQAADLVGYDGKKLRKSVDKVLDANDQRNKELADDLEKADDQ